MAETMETLASLSLTHVYYNPGDKISYLSAWLALVPQALCVSYVTLMWAAREVEIIMMFAGQMWCEAVNFALKRIIREERPKQMFGKGYGMPSSHSQFVSFFAVYLSLFLLLRHVPYPKSSPSSLTYLERVGVSILAMVGASMVSLSRIYLNYHTPKQVLAGSATGVVSAVVWFLFTSYLRYSGWIDWGLDLSLVKLARIRDLLMSEDLAEAGWQRWQTKRTSKKGQNHVTGRKDQ